MSLELLLILFEGVPFERIFWSVQFYLECVFHLIAG